MHKGTAGGEVVCFSACVPLLRIPCRAYRADERKGTSSCTHARRGVGGGGHGRSASPAAARRAQLGPSPMLCHAQHTLVDGVRDSRVLFNDRQWPLGRCSCEDAQTSSDTNRFAQVVSACLRPAPSTPLSSMGRVHPRSTTVRWCAPLCAASRQRRGHAAVAFAAQASLCHNGQVSTGAMSYSMIQAVEHGHCRSYVN